MENKSKLLILVANKLENGSKPNKLYFIIRRLRNILHIGKISLISIILLKSVKYIKLAKLKLINNKDILRKYIKENFYSK